MNEEWAEQLLADLSSTDRASALAGPLGAPASKFDILLIWLRLTAVDTAILSAMTATMEGDSNRAFAELRTAMDKSVELNRFMTSTFMASSPIEEQNS